MSTEKQPFISIAMTVFNSEFFLAKTLRSLLDQDFSNFELIISDNASDDGSSEICQEFAKRDARIKYYRNTSNMGPARNSYKAVDLCSGDFIMPAADHDVYHPGFISRLLELLQQDESVVLAYPRSLYIDENDQPIELLPDVIDTRHLDACQRFKKIIWEFAWGNMVYGLYRSAAFRAVWHTHPTIGPDHVMIAKLSLLGSIAQTDEPLFFRRSNRPVEDTQECTKRQVSLFVDSNFESLIPWTRMAYEHLKIVAESGFGDTTDKEFLYDEVRRCFPARFGTVMRNEALKLCDEAPNIFLNACCFPNTHDFVQSEIARVAQMCKFFYPDIAELKELAAGHFCYRVDAGMCLPENAGVHGQIKTQQIESVSVVIPTHNRAHILSRAINSVLGQTYPIHEIIVVDDGSTDDTELVIRPFQEQYPQVKYFKIHKNGAQTARNEGIRQATGNWIAFLDSDDEYLPHKIEKQMDVARLEKVSIVHCECYVKRDDQPPVLFGTPALSGNIYQAVLCAPGPTFPGLLVRKSSLQEIGLLDQAVPSFQEWDTVIMLAKDNNFGYVSEPLFIYYCHGGETISKDMKRHTMGYAYIVEKHTVDILNYAGKDALADHYRTLMQYGNNYGLPLKAQIYYQKLFALLSGGD